MKEIMLPYIFIIWVLVKTGVIQWTLRNAVIYVGIGLFLSLMLFTAHRFWSPADLTDSSTIKAPHAVLSPLFGEEVDSVHVVHNQVVKKGDVIYKLVSTDGDEKIEALVAQVNAKKASIESLKVTIKNDYKNLSRLTRLNDFASESSRDDLLAKIETAEANLIVGEADINKLNADINAAKWSNDRKVVRAPFDGQMSVTTLADGTRLGNLHIYDTSKKFLEMRIPDQAYRYIKVGQFAEFYVDAFPGEIFRGRVHSLTAGTGEAMLNNRASEQQVRQHVGNNAGSHGRTVIIEFIEPQGYNIPIGATGSAWISAEKPMPVLGFMDIIGGATVRLKALKSYLSAL
ncbi:hemolysin D [Psychromonas sp. psych-6C06]|uniref:HlyD family secretion protein n=1 Tax=Psychromonas sp. psych-6C06 TaxID=2058089 RepID=UPI000C337CD3|nr:efflux RND transporter periplasmic adaptor subunit [Psychromonas sp. psych-6C06]PKF62502.1 hemolysin D [Psychromonas sp. psych-6C06]